MADRDELVSQFTAISGVDSERARFFLESAAWNLESALSSFYEEGEEEGGGGGGGDAALGERPETEGAPKPATPPSSPQRNAQSSAIQRSLINMMDRGIDEDSDEDGQAFYAGGSEHSGQQVLGPPRKKSDMVAKLFKSAKEHGAEVLDTTRDGKKQKTLMYSGTGYRLGETSDDTQVIPDSKRKEERPRDVSLKMWKTGFTVDDGPLRAYDDPSNAEFLSAIRRSEVPLELVREARGGEVYINMADHRHEDYVGPKVTMRAFTGSGHTLGSPAPSVVGQVTHPARGATSPMAAAAAAPTTDFKVAEKSAQEKLNVDTSQPTTTVQLRMPDGSRVAVQLNHCHTVGDVRHYVQTARPVYQTRDFGLMTTFPYAELTNLSLTVTEAKLLNSALVIKEK